MSQTTIIVASLMAAFVIFITARGHLPLYLGALLPSADPAAVSGGGGW